MKSVRPTNDFYDQLSSYLPFERGEDGTPSRHDFESHDLFDIIARFAHEWDRLPQAVPGRDEYRMVLGAGETMASYMAVGQLAPDGSVEIVEIEQVVHPDFLSDPEDGDDQT